MKKSKKKKEQIETKNNYTVYKHTSPDGKVYIGSTSLNPKYRWNYGKGYKRCTRFFKAINEIGWDNFEHEILFENLSQSEAEKIEEEYIKKYKSTDEKFGFNMADGASLIGYKRTEETKQRMSEAQKGRKIKPESIKKRSEKVKANRTYAGKNNGMYGRHHTKETREKIRLSNTGKKHTEESRKKMSESRKGIKQSEEAKAKKREKMIGERNPFYGRKHTEESRSKVSEKNSKKVICLETGEIFKSSIFASRSMGLNDTAVSGSIRGKSKTAGGFHWKYLEETKNEN